MGILLFTNMLSPKVVLCPAIAFITILLKVRHGELLARRIDECWRMNTGYIVM